MIVGHTAHGGRPGDEDALFPIEGRFLSVADRSYVLGLPPIDREELLAKRTASVFRKEQDRQLKLALAAVQKINENHKKRKIDSEVEDRAPQSGDSQQFTVHRDLVCANSKFFKAACSKLWAEGKEKVVRLPDVKVDAFKAYVVWIYSGKVTVNTSNKEATDKSSAEFKEIVELYLLAGILDDLQLRNAAMRTMVMKSKDWKIQPSAQVINRIWNSTSPGSLLRKMVLDKTIMRFSRSEFEKDSADYPKDLLHSMAVALMKKVATVSCDVFVAGLDEYLEPEVSGDSDKSN